MSQVAICIINFNTYEKTFECISAIRKNITHRYNIYLLDNGSSNESKEKLKEAYRDSEDVKLFFSNENLGYARGNNLLLHHAQRDGCKYSVIMNNDVICINSAIDIMVNVLQTNNDIFMVAPKMFDVNHQIQVTAKRKKPTYISFLKKETLVGRFCPRELREELEWVSTCEELTSVYWISGAIFAARMSDFNELNFFDEYTFLYFEEYILSEKAAFAGKKMAFIPQAEVLHFHGASTGTGFNFKTRCENWRSEVYFWKKYIQISRWKLWILFVIRIFETFLFGRREKGIMRHLINYVEYGTKELRKDCMEV